MQEHSNRISPRGKIQYIPIDRGFGTPCWEWQMHRNEKGYGRLRLNGKNTPAHRLYYERYKGQIPEGYHIDHLCRNRACVNPDHLEPVTPAENNRRGNGAKLSYEQVKEIRSLQGQYSSRKIAAMYGVDKTQILRIWNGERWRDTGVVAVNKNIPFLHRILFNPHMNTHMGESNTTETLDTPRVSGDSSAHGGTQK